MPDISVTDWIIASSAAASTLVAVAAIFGDWIKRRIFPPKIEIKLVESLPQKTPLYYNNSDGSLNSIGWGRFFLIQISNKTRNLYRLEEPQIAITEIEIKGPQRQWIRAWSGLVKLSWQYKDSEELGIKHNILGHDRIADFFHINSMEEVSFGNSKVPTAFSEVIKSEYQKDHLSIRFKIVGQTVEVDSTEILIQIEWDKKFHSDDSLAGKSLSVSQISP